MNGMAERMSKFFDQKRFGFDKAGIGAAVLTCSVRVGVAFTAVAVFKPRLVTGTAVPTMKVKRFASSTQQDMDRLR